MVCPACGYNNDEDARFCNMCGIRMAAPGSLPGRRQASLSAREIIRPLIQPMGDSKLPRGLKRKKPLYKRWWFWLVMLALLLSFAVIFLSMQNNRFDLMERPQTARQQAGAIQMDASCADDISILIVCKISFISRVADDM